ncbi:phage tail terminator-like protein [Arsenophonus apicola]|uniref:Phage tail terminator-like protein n=1 Tax=Arsenophonus apicola TaxID=2879119 RepID=A0ABY8NZM9_9GAMM|nr:phage tail terminator-like protein [Arsenophonus apicola]WGO82296.1 phage tail terminator-like protein [Arsenophonus apicola]
MNPLTINTAIRAHIAQFAESENIKVAWPNCEFDDINEPYLQLHIMPATTKNLSLSLDMLVFSGVIQINVVGRAGTGDTLVMNVANRLINYLTNGFSLTDNLFLNGEPCLFPAICDQVNYILPVSVAYRCHSTI